MTKQKRKKKKRKKKGGKTEDNGNTTNAKTLFDDTSSNVNDALKESESVGLDQLLEDLQMGGNDARVVEQLTDVPKKFECKVCKKSSNQPQCIKTERSKKHIQKMKKLGFA